VRSRHVSGFEPDGVDLAKKLVLLFYNTDFFTLLGRATVISLLLDVLN
jgi:hypothetical protein